MIYLDILVTAAALSFVPCAILTLIWTWGR